MKRRTRIGATNGGNNLSAIGGQDTDQHSGFYEIELDDELTIEENKQMTNWNNLSINGTIIIDGDLILK